MVSGKRIYSVGGGLLIVCLDVSITASDAETLGAEIVVWHERLATVGDVTCIFRDNAFVDDIAKINLTIFLRARGISSIRSI